MERIEMTTNTEFKVGDIVNAHDKSEFYYGLPDCNLDIDTTKVDLYKDIADMERLTIVQVGKHENGKTIYLLENAEGMFLSDNESNHMTLVSRPESKEPKFKYVPAPVGVINFGVECYFKYDDDSVEKVIPLCIHPNESKTVIVELTSRNEIKKCTAIDLYIKEELTEEDELVEVIQNLLDKWHTEGTKLSKFEYLAKSGKLKLA